MNIEKLTEIPGCLLVCFILLLPHLLVVAFWAFLIIGAWKGWTK